MTLVDNHNHILLAEITEMLAAAKANNVSEFSITEHVSQFREPRESIRFGSIHPSGRIFQSLKDYDDEFRKADRLAYSGMKINRGLEVDFSPRFETRLGDFVNQEEWDILLCSVHEFDDLLLDLARVARRRNKALELNGRDIDYAPELVRRLARACSKADCRVSLGSDAHHPSEVFRNMGVAMALVKEFDLELT